VIQSNIFVWNLHCDGQSTSEDIKQA